MRISDWSSDVCSSDLCHRLSPFQFKSHHQHLWTGDILGAVWSGKLPIRKFAGCVYVPGQGEVISGDKWGGRYNTWRKRSEEHTSKLQSLMRISYAVFCLKKNKERRSLQHHRQITKRHHVHNN